MASIKTSSETQKLTLFEKEGIGQLRTTRIADKEYFVAKDIACLLGYSNSHDAISRHCKGVVIHDHLSNGGIQSTSMIPESDVWRMIIKSNLPNAEKIEEWIMEEVLPSIRKTGGYSTKQVQPAISTQSDYLRQLSQEYAYKAGRCIAYAAELDTLAEKFSDLLPQQPKQLQNRVGANTKTHLEEVAPSVSLAPEKSKAQLIREACSGYSRSFTAPQISKKLADSGHAVSSAVCSNQLAKMVKRGELRIHRVRRGVNFYRTAFSS